MRPPPPRSTLFPYTTLFRSTNMMTQKKTILSGWWACESRRGRSRRGSGRCSGLSVVRGRLRGLSWGNRPHLGGQSPLRQGIEQLAGAHDGHVNSASGGDVDAGTPETPRLRVACRNPPVGTERWSFDDPVAKLPRLYVEGEAATLRAEHLPGAGSTRSERTAAVGSAAEQRGRVCKRARLSSRLWTANEGSDSGLGLLTLLEARGRRDAHSRGPSCSSRARVSMSIQSVTGRFRTRRMRVRILPEAISCMNSKTAVVTHRSIFHTS